MTDLEWLDSKIRRWLKRVPLSAIVILLEAIREEVGTRAAAKPSSIRSRQEAEFLRGWAAAQSGRKPPRVQPGEGDLAAHAAPDGLRAAAAGLPS